MVIFLSSSTGGVPMEQSFEFKINDFRKTLVEQFQDRELYVPLHGKYTINPDEEPFDLAEKIKQFFVFDEKNMGDPRVMLLMGDTGSGKSIFAQQLYQQLWQARKEGDPIPLWIPLPELLNPFDGAVEEILTKYGYS